MWCCYDTMLCGLECALYNMDLPTRIKHARARNIEPRTHAGCEVPLSSASPLQTVDEAPTHVDVVGGFSAVLLPTSSCPALLLLEPPVVPTLDATGANTTTLHLTTHAPWRTVARKGSADAP